MNNHYAEYKLRRTTINIIYNVREARTVDDKLAELSSVVGLEKMPWLKTREDREAYLTGLEHDYTHGRAAGTTLGR